jgi:predicted N-acyltransferase
MTLSHRMFESIDTVPMADWERIRCQSTSPIFLDPRFIAAVEASMNETCRFRHLIIYDGDVPVACASLTDAIIDLTDVADPGLAAVIRRLPGVLSRFRELRLLMCGLPGTASHSSVAVAAGHAAGPIVSRLDQLVCGLAAEWKMHGVTYKEFSADDLAWIDCLRGRGYSRVASPPTYTFAARFTDLEDYAASLKTHYRRHVRLAANKLAANGVAVSILKGGAELCETYTPEVHALYDAMVDRSDFKFDRLPFRFFHELARRLADHVEVIVLSQKRRVVAFGWALHDASAYHVVVGGIDDALKRELDLYFNLVYASLDRGLRKGVQWIEIGQTGDFFKSKVGCQANPRYIFIKGVGPVMATIARLTAPLMVARTPAPPTFDIFKRGEGQSAPAGGRAVEDESRAHV